MGVEHVDVVPPHRPSVPAEADQVLVVAEHPRPGTGPFAGQVLVVHAGSAGWCAARHRRKRSSLPWRRQALRTANLQFGADSGDGNGKADALDVKPFPHDHADHSPNRVNQWTPAISRVHLR